MNNTSLLGEVRKNFDKHSQQPAIHLPGENVVTITFSEVWERAEHYAPVIEDCFVPDQVVPIYLSRGHDCLSIMLACIITGRAFSVLNNRIQLPQLKHILAQTQSRAFFADGPIVRMLSRADDSGLDFLTGIEILLVKNETWMSMFEKQQGRLRSDLLFRELNVEDFGEIPRSLFADSIADHSSSSIRPAACLFTSGSTGRPKGVLISDSDLVARATVEAQCFEIRTSDRLLSVLPWSFDVGLSQVLTSWMTGCSLVISNSWLPNDIVETCKNLSVTGISAVPSIWIDFLASQLTFASPAPRYATVSGGSLSSGDQAALIECLAETSVMKTYGQTETCRSSIAMPQDIKAAPESIGRAYPGTRLYIIDEELSELPPGSVGEILHTGDGTMLGYLYDTSDEKLVDNPFYAPPQNASQLAVRTGDFGHLDEQGRLFLLGRKDDMVKIKGNRVFLSEIVAEVVALQEIQEAVVLHTEGDTSEILLFATLAAQQSVADTKALKKLLTGHLPAYMVPNKIWILDSFPRTASGKPDRQKLRDISTGAS